MVPYYHGMPYQQCNCRFYIRIIYSSQYSDNYDTNYQQQMTYVPHFIISRKMFVVLSYTKNKLH